MTEEFDQRVLESMQRHAARLLGPRWSPGDVSAERRFDELGIDSLQLAEIAFAVLEELDVYVPMAQVARTKTIGEFLQLVRTESAA